MHLQVTAVPDPTLIAAATRRRLRGPILVTRAAGWTLLGVALLTELVTGRLPMGLVVTGALVAVLAPMMLLNHTARRSLRNGRLTTYEISDGGVAQSSESGRHSYAWTAFDRVETLRGQLLFGLRTGRWIRIPTRGLSPVEITEILDTATARGLQVRR
ncbi:YcxB family protein [Actinoplanes sp. NPDC051851]|uniref:YcxB family protein n=1 Tax=Actinoplanes sp. NPDC051851 TaxID=3154753 RepID=UPI00343A8156